MNLVAILAAFSYYTFSCKQIALGCPSNRQVVVIEGTLNLEHLVAP
jgi:hypothetical protein